MYSISVKFRARSRRSFAGGIDSDPDERVRVRRYDYVVCIVAHHADHAVRRDGGDFPGPGCAGAGVYLLNKVFQEKDKQ